MLTVECRAMGSRVFVALDAASGFDPRLDVPSWFVERELCASRFRSDSELCRLNARSGEWVSVSAGLFAEIAAALAAARWSAGLSTPTVLEALERAGYDRSFEQLAPAERARLGGEPAPSFEDIRLDAASSRVFLPRGVRLDLGGTAKGRAADELCARLGSSAPALVDAGGDIAVSAPRSDGSPWPVGVASPLDDTECLATLALSGGGVATSGRDHRRWSTDLGDAHHLIDPRTGSPARTDVLCATVVASSAARADVAAKVLLIAGSDAGLAWLEREPDLAALLVLETGATRQSARLERHLWNAA